MADYLLHSWPLVVALVVYFVRLESRLAKICTDLSWLKKHAISCQQPSDQNTT